MLIFDICRYASGPSEIYPQIKAGESLVTECGSSKETIMANGFPNTYIWSTRLPTQTAKIVPRRRRIGRDNPGLAIAKTQRKNPRRLF